MSATNIRKHQTAQARPRQTVENPETLKRAVAVFLQYLSPRLLTAATFGAWSVRLYLGHWSVWDLAIVAGLVAFWPIQEWLIHVYILHFRPIMIFGRTFDPVTSREHRAHHRDPWRQDLVFIPYQVLIPALPAHVVLWSLVMPSHALAFTMIAFYFTMSLHYEWVHYLVHTRYQPTSSYYKKLWRSHRLHHCKNEHYWYGVTMLEGDRLLRTSPDHRHVAISPTCRTLGYEDNLGLGQEAA